MSNEKSVPCWLTAHIKLNPVLEEAVIDFLVGVMNGAVEQTVDLEGSDMHLNVYFEEKNLNEQSRLHLQNNLKAQLGELAQIFQVKEPEVSWEFIEDQDWSSNWKVHFKPFEITKGLSIVPTWEDYQPRENEKIITMDPGMAFGTGHHASTSLALNLIRQVMSSGRQSVSVLDVGCGTGILAMGALLFGATEVVGIDNDPEAVRVASENVELNTCTSRVDISQIALQDLSRKFDCIVANIIYDVLITMIEDFKRLLIPGGDLILSGILNGAQEQNIIQVYEQSGFSLIRKELKEEWAAFHFQKK
jgi:ribosomal protein L11 methyltransferase